MFNGWHRLRRNPSSDPSDRDAAQHVGHNSMMNRRRSLLLAAAAVVLATATGCGTETVNDTAEAQRAYKAHKGPIMPPDAMRPKGGVAFVGKPTGGGPPGGGGGAPPAGDGQKKGAPPPSHSDQ